MALDANALPSDVPALLRAQLERNRSLRIGQPANTGQAGLLAALREWQTRRLARTYADLLADQRYRPAAEFFLSDVYGSRDFSRRDEDVERIYPLMVKLLPNPALYTIALAIEVNALTVELDRALAAALTKLMGRRRRIEVSDYAQAYRDCDNRADRSHQLELILRVGQALDAVVAKPLLYPTLRMMRKPARTAGFGELQDFLERGFVAFRHMAGATHFLATIEAREKSIMRRIYAGRDDPFEIGS
ncbi:MAG: hypothetical protein IT531_18410 [Burkholderiales bacterium]|nr:hypothetical protein [Burkholderiales bacterium]